MTQSLGDRMKNNYENRCKYTLPRRTYILGRIDGRAFHSYTKKQKCNTPFDVSLMYDMNRTMEYLAVNIQGFQVGYKQSDEISFLLFDGMNKESEAFFDNEVQKMSSIIASMATGAFLRLRMCRKAAENYEAFGKGEVSLENLIPEKDIAQFDCRVWSVSDPVEVENYFIWRWKDWCRNSISMLARAHFSHKELHKKSVSDMHEMLHQKGVNWADCTEEIKNGSWVIKKEGKWVVEACPNFKDSRLLLTEQIPKFGY